MKEYTLDDIRLSTAASFARVGAVAADIGTDHAHLALHLVLSGKAPKAVASDINEGPLAAAKHNIEQYGLSDRIDTVLTDGLDNIDSYAPEDIYILGMGGELIYRIVSQSELPRAGRVRLILQPMTHPQDLRRGLLKDGFLIVDEACVRDGERIYQLIVAEYDGVKRELSEVEYWLGRINLSRKTDEVVALAEKYARALKKRIDGLGEAGVKDAEAELLYSEFLKIAKGNQNDC